MAAIPNHRPEDGRDRARPSKMEGHAPSWPQGKGEVGARPKDGRDGARPSTGKSVEGHGSSWPRSQTTAPKADATERVPPRWRAMLRHGRRGRSAGAGGDGSHSFRVSPSGRSFRIPPFRACVHAPFRPFPPATNQTPHQKTRKGGWNQFCAMRRMTMADSKESLLCKKQVELLICTNSGSALGIPNWPSCRRGKPLAS